jgi:hypothetical protein
MMVKNAKKYILTFVALLAFVLILAACQSAPTPGPVTPPPAPVCPTAAACPVPTAAPTPTPVAAAPNQAAWAASPHNDAKAAAFNDWNTTTDKSVPTTCAKCHSTSGYQDFLGADGSKAGVVDKAVPVGETITCNACHNSATATLSSVTFTSGVTLNNLGPEARCMVCHQGRAAQKTVDDQIAKFKATDPDAQVAPIKNADGTSTTFSFINVHYFAAALTLYGSQVDGGYQYPNKIYDTKNQHVDGYDTCVQCHDPHTTAVRVDQCAQCHDGVKTVDDLKNIRQVSSAMDYNGNGNVKEGIALEIQGMQDTLLKSIQSYAKDVAGMGIVYDPATYPYFLQDKGSTGTADKDSSGAAVSYANWTPRLLQAAYNYQMSSKDPGAFAHNPKYIIELLYDSTADLDTKLASKIDMSKMVRDDAGHFAGDTQPFRDWDSTGIVPAACAKCHSATGLPQYIANAGTEIVTKSGVQITGVVGQPVSNGFECKTCHDESNFPNRLAVTSVPFPSGVSLTFSSVKDANGNLVPVDANLCIECHQGRESTVTVNNALAAYVASPDNADPKISFKNVHYLAAGATFFGTQAKGMYEYAGKTYDGKNLHVDTFDTCTDCHDAHALTIKTTACAACHKEGDPTKFRKTTESYDGSTDASEPMAAMVENFRTKLYAAVQKYTKDHNLPGVIYDPASYPYFFLDANNDGKPDVDSKGAVISYNSFTPRLMEAAYNLQYVTKDPGAFAHNPHYVIEGMYDSIADLGGDLTGLTRPTPAAPAK